MSSEKNKISSRRLQTIEEIIGLTPSEMAKIGGCSRSTYYRYRSGESVPDLVFINNILKNENRINAEWLLRGEGPILVDKGDGVQEESADSEQITFVNLPLYEMEPESRDTEGKLSLEEWENPSRSLPLCNMFLEGIVGENPEELFAMKVACNSMSPEIKPGSLVLVDRDEVDPSVDGIFVIRFDELLRMKLLQRLPNNRLQLSTLSDKYQPVEISLGETDNFEIMGRIQWVGTPL